MKPFCRFKQPHAINKLYAHQISLCVPLSGDLILTQTDNLSEPIWRFGGSGGTISEGMILGERGTVHNVPQHDAVYWVLSEQTIILVNQNKEPIAALKKVSEDRYAGLALPAARGYQPGLTYFMEKIELTYPLALTWENGCTEFLKRNRIFLLHGMRNDGVIQRGERVPFARPVFVEPEVTLPLKRFVSMGAYSYVVGAMSGDYSVGRYTSIAQRVQIMGEKHPMDRLTMHPITYHYKHAELARELGIPQEAFDAVGGPVTIGNDVWIGEGVLIATGVTIGNGAVVAARSIVTRDVPPYTMVAGSPAKPVRMRFETDLVDLLLQSKWWEFNIVDIPPHWSDPRRAVMELLDREADGKVQRWKPKPIDLAPALFKASILG